LTLFLLRILDTRVGQIIVVRLIAAGVILDRWRARPPRPGDLARTMRSAGRTLRASGPRGLLRAFNAGTHTLARAGSTRTPLRIHKALERAAYRQWVRRFDDLSDEDRRAIEDATSRLVHRPLLSVLMPVYNSDERWLRAAITSVREQLYDRWELCIADDHSSDARVGEVLRELQAQDPRIKVEFRPVNGHISAASNSALALATGEFVVLLDHDDVLPQHALLAVVHELNRHPDADIVYSDEDRLDEKGRRYDPYYKPDWSPELLRGQNLISHLGVYRTVMVRQVGGFREGFEGSQDYDLALRVVEATEPHRIRHIPHVLYHWRAIAGSAARGVEEKPYTHGAARRAVQEHLDRSGLQATCEPAPHLRYHQRIRYALPEPHPHVTIIIPTRDHADMLTRCVRSVTSRSTYDGYDIVIVDNGSVEAETLACLDQLRHDARFSILRVDEPFNFSRLNNLAAARARGSVLCFLNNDTEVISPDWLEEMVSLAVQKDVGAVGAMLYYPDDTVQHAGVILGLGGVAAHAHSRLPRGAPGNYGRAALTQALCAVTAACLVVRKSVFDEAGGFDEQLGVAYNDVDLCLRLRERGLRNVWTPFAELYHFESVSRGRDTAGDVRPGFLIESRLMHERWGPLLAADPYFNPNLSLWRADFGLAYPPRHTRRWWES
jgi:glycosyltransferase involved in cell wall biosynthesis